MIIKFVESSEGKLLIEEDVNLHKANMYLSIRSIHFENTQYNVIDSTYGIEEDELQILLEEA